MSDVYVIYIECELAEVHLSARVEDVSSSGKLASYRLRIGISVHKANIFMDK